MRFLVVLSAVVGACLARPGYLAGGVARLAAAPALAAPALAATPLAAAPLGTVVGPAVAARTLAAAPVATVVAPAVISEQHHAQDTIGQYRYGYSDGLTTKGEFRTADGITQGAYAYVDGNGVVQNVAYTADAAGFRVAASNLPQAPAVPEAPELQAPEPVQDTAEVVAAKAAHQVAVDIAETRARAIPVAVSAPVVTDAAVRSVAVAAPAAVPARSADSIVVAAAPVSLATAAVPSRAFAYSSVAAAPLIAAPAPYTGPQHLPTITAAGVPVDTVEVQAARAADVVAHINAKASLLG